MLVGHSLGALVVERLLPGRRLLARHGRGSTLDVVEGAGHMLMLQDAGARVLVERIVAVQDAPSRAGGRRVAGGPHS